MNGGGDHSYALAHHLDYLSMLIVCITTMHSPICLDSRRPRFSLYTWPSNAYGFLMLGYVRFRAALLFVCYISIKCK
jgi:hypothetical protein